MCEVMEIPNGWEKVEIFKVSTLIKSGGTPKSDNKSFYNGDIKFTTIEDITASNKYLYSTNKTITELGFKNSNTWLVGKNNLLYSIYATLGVPIITKTEVTTNQAILGIELNDTVDLEFIYYRLLFDKEQILSNATQTTQSNLNATIIKNTLLLLPKSKQEQQKIAEILSELDNAIFAAESLLKKNKKLKIALMQDLLSCGIDENGKIRNLQTHKFKPSELGNIPEEWRTEKLGNIKFFTLKTGGTPSTERKEYWDNGHILWMSSGEVNNKYIYDTTLKITELGYKSSNATMIPKYSILMALAGQGKTRGTVAMNYIELTTNQSLAAIICNFEEVVPQFLFYYLESQYENLRNISYGAGRAGLSLKILREVDIIFPPFPEQQKIAEILSSQDKKIEAIQTKLTKLKSLKASLMQDLLSGKRRVTKLMGKA